MMWLIINHLFQSVIIKLSAIPGCESPFEYDSRIFIPRCAFRRLKEN